MTINSAVTSSSMNISLSDLETRATSITDRYPFYSTNTGLYIDSSFISTAEIASHQRTSYRLPDEITERFEALENTVKILNQTVMSLLQEIHTIKNSSQ